MDQYQESQYNYESSIHDSEQKSFKKEYISEQTSEIPQNENNNDLNKSVYIRALGNAPLIGKACIFIDIAQQCSFILDCGIPDNFSKGPQIEKQLKYENKIVFPDHDADFMFISHAHQDHAGAVDQILSFQNQTISNSSYINTKKLGNNNLYTDSSLNNNSNEAEHKKVYVSVLTQQLMINANPKLRNALTGIEFYQKIYPINGRTDIYFIITPAGHIPGSSIFTIVTPSLTLVYTGDYLLTPTSLLSGAKFPQEAINADVLISEVTFVQFVFRSPVYSDVLWFQHVLQLALANIPVMMPVSSFGTAQERISLIGDFLTRCFLDKSKINVEVTQGSQAEIYKLFIQHLDQCEANKSKRGLFINDLFTKYKQFHDGTEQKRQIVFTCPQKFAGGVTIDLLFEKLADDQGLICFLGNSQPGTQNWRFLNNIVTQIKRDNMKSFVPVQWTCSQTQYQTHADFVQFMKMLQFIKPKFLCLTHTSDTRNLNLVRQCVEQCYSGFIKCSVLSQTATVLRFFDDKKSLNGIEYVVKNKVVIIRIKHNQTLDLLVKKLQNAGFCMILDKKAGIYRCGQNFQISAQYACIRLIHKIQEYRMLFELLSTNFSTVKSLLEQYVAQMEREGGFQQLS